MAFKPPAQAPKGLWRRTPPAIFPPIMGLFGVGLGWRRGVGEFGLPPELAEAFLGGVTLLFVFALLAYLVKLARRPAVLAEDLRILPGRAGVTAMVMCVMLLGAVLVPYAPGEARPLVLLALALHLGLAILLITLLLGGPKEQRVVTPVWHLSFVGFIVAGLSLPVLGLPGLARAILFATLPVAGVIWAVSAVQFARATVPAPLRPLLAIHLAPVSLCGTVALLVGYPGLSQAFAVLAAAVVLVLAAAARWLTAAGFSPLWGAFTFPLAAASGLWLALGGAWRIPGGLLLIVATFVTVPIAIKVMQLWAKGQLAIKTNAAIA